MTPAGFEPAIPASELPQTHTTRPLPLIKQLELIIFSQTPQGTKKKTIQEIKEEF